MLSRITLSLTFTCFFISAVMGQEEIIVSEPVIFGLDGTEIPFDSGAVITEMSIGSVDDNGSAEQDLMRMLRNKSIREELELADDQFKQMQEFNSQQQKEMQSLTRDLLKGIGNGGQLNVDPDLLKNLQEKMRTRGEQSKKQLEEMLLPHQVTRLKQIAYQRNMENNGSANALTNGELAEELQLTDEQKKQLREKSATINKRLEDEIAKLRAEAKEELFSVLSEDQRDKLRHLIGKEFKSEKGSPLDRLESIRSGLKKGKTFSRIINSEK